MGANADHLGELLVKEQEAHDETHGALDRALYDLAQLRARQEHLDSALDRIESFLEAWEELLRKLRETIRGMR